MGNVHKNLLNTVFNKLKNSGSARKIEAISKITDIILASQECKLDQLIDPIVAVNDNIPDTDEEREKKFVIVFENYNQDQCELSKLNTSTAKALTSKLKHLTSITEKELPGSGLIRDDVNDSGDYHSLYQKLEPDITLKEIEFANDSRIFGFFKNEYFSLVAIWADHGNLH